MTARKPRRGTRRYALERTFEATPALRDDRHAAVVDLARVLADQVDAAGPDGPSTRLTAAYLSVLGQLTRAAASAGTTKPAGPSALARMRASSMDIGRQA